MNDEPSKPDVLQLTLSRYHSLDVVRLPKARKYRVVFAERFGVQRRDFVEISFDEAARLALLLADVEDGIIVADGVDPPTDPSRPTDIAPPNLRDLAVDQAARAALTGLASDPIAQRHRERDSKRPQR